VASAASLPLLFTGCDAINAPRSWRERFAPEPQVRVYDAEQAAVFAAARAALLRMDFTIGRSRPKQGALVALSALHPGDTFGRAQQYSLEVTVRPADEPGRTEVAVLLRQQEESSSFSGATEVPVAQHGLYDSFFAALEAALPAKEAIPPK
jgi:hypothetical protein